jgi:hypothetical protein
MKRTVLLVAIFIVTIVAYEPIFGQQYTAYMSNSFGTSNYTYYFDFLGQRDRVDYAGPDNTSVTLMDHNANLAYIFFIVGGQEVECYVYQQYVPLEKFTFPSGLLWWGSATVNDIDCDEYIE